LGQIRRHRARLSPALRARTALTVAPIGLQAVTPRPQSTSRFSAGGVWPLPSLVHSRRPTDPPVSPLGRLFKRPLQCCLSESGPRSSGGGEWLWGGVCPIVPRTPGLIWVLGLVAGDVMVDGSFRGERLRPLGLWWTAARGRESRQLRELANPFQTRILRPGESRPDHPHAPVVPSGCWSQGVGLWLLVLGEQQASTPPCGRIPLCARAFESGQSAASRRMALPRPPSKTGRTARAGVGVGTGSHADAEAASSSAARTAVPFPRRRPSSERSAAGSKPAGTDRPARVSPYLCLADDRCGREREGPFVIHGPRLGDAPSTATDTSSRARRRKPRGSWTPT
jgi:hypothetical protein